MRQPRSTLHVCVYGRAIASKYVAFVLSEPGSVNPIRPSGSMPRGRKHGDASLSKPRRIILLAIEVRRPPEKTGHAVSGSDKATKRRF